MTRLHWIVVAAIIIALTLPSALRVYESAQQWSQHAGDQAACAYAQQADVAAGHFPRTCAR